MNRIEQKKDSLEEVSSVYLKKADEYYCYQLINQISIGQKSVGAC